MADPIEYHTSNATVAILTICLVALIGLLVFFYFYLNKEANDEYTIHQLVYKQGGLRDHLRDATLALEGRLGVQLWPRNDSADEGEEMQEIQCEEGQVDEISSLISWSKRDEKEADGAACGGVHNEEASDKSSLDGSDTRREAPEKQEEEEESSEIITVLDQDCGGAGIVINLNQLSGNAIWSEEQDGDGNVTAL
ncbi:uncharacterized protein si:ch211-119e14.1 [Synchiropus splendidus]|uniref:uncharacterized protein si:ch211-119e14.1 n=1 Tax=Synchiropus splendidus TaxID=270530 RepID=UPI00237E4077|nr:uncharacterized protein si:ch211-119e14.1 [Synchiropus splendidus]